MNKNIKRIYIDPGHGGTESGANSNGVLEKNINLEVALALKNRLELKGFEVAMSRYQDSTVSLKERCDMSNLWGADLFISIHHNAANGKAKGFEVYHATNSVNGAKFAELVGKEFGKTQARRYVGSGLYGGSKAGDYYVLKNTNAPAILTEYLFIDNKDDLIKYKPHVQVDALYTAICKYFNIEDETPEQPIQEVKHWAEKHYDKLTKHGIIIHEKRFDDKITRGEAMALLAQFID